MQIAESSMTVTIEFRETIQEIYTVHTILKIVENPSLTTYINSSKTVKINTSDSFDGMELLSPQWGWPPKSCKKDC